VILRRLLSAVLLAVLWPVPALPQQTYTFTPQSSRGLTLTFQTQREGGSRVLIQGEVHNSSTMSAERIMVKAEGLDENGRVVSRGRVYVPGTLTPRGTAAFEIRLSSSGSERRFRVEIEAFEFVGPRAGQ